MAVDLTLERVRRLAAHLPSYTRPTCHIAGTNGKGSVSAILSSILLASLPPFTIGRFNSPHLLSVHDSIVINQAPVTPAFYSSARSEVEAANKDYCIGASSFELLTLTALLIFERCHVDIAVIEVGMGGRLDATNVISDECILVSALSAVDLDHQAFLGPTIVEIAREKAGIARRGRPFVIGPQGHSQVEDIVKSVVAERGADLVQSSAAIKRTWEVSIDGPVSLVSFLPSSFLAPLHQPVRVEMPCFPDAVSTLLSLHGEHQLENLGLASMVVSTLLTHPWCTRTLSLSMRERITPTSVAKGVMVASWPGRLSFHTINVLSGSPADAVSTNSANSIVLVDGAHNPASSSSLAVYLSHLFRLAVNNDFQGSLGMKPRQLSLTYIIALSDSPPKTPAQTLLPVLQLTPPLNLKVKIKIAVLRFTPPEGMPWVTPVSPSELRQVVLSLIPDADIWVAPDEEDPRQGQLLRAFEWAADQQGAESEQLVVLFGSLYLVADFYRLLRDGLLVNTN